jgi:subtilisin family serine protease
VTAVIREKAPDAEVFAVKVFDRDLSTSAEALVAALGWAVASGSALVNLSLGTRNPGHASALGEAVDAARRAGVVIVAAGPTPDAAWLPGGLPGVIAVSLDDSLPRDACVIEASEEGMLATACGLPRPIPGVPPERNLRGLSFAVANVSGLLACALEGAAAGEPVRSVVSRTARHGVRA